MYFTAMWDEIPNKKPYDKDPTGKKPIKNYLHMLDVLNHVFGKAPEWTDGKPATRTPRHRLEALPTDVVACSCVRSRHGWRANVQHL